MLKYTFCYGYPGEFGFCLCGFLKPLEFWVGESSRAVVHLLACRWSFLPPISKWGHVPLLMNAFLFSQKFIVRIWVLTSHCSRIRHRGLKSSAGCREDWFTFQTFEWDIKNTNHWSIFTLGSFLVLYSQWTSVDECVMNDMHSPS